MDRTVALEHDPTCDWPWRARLPFSIEIRRRPGLHAVLLTSAALLLTGCAASSGTNSGLSQTTQHGYVVSPTALEQVPVGSSRDQVMIALGSPTTIANYDTDVFYYISQTRQRSVQFLPDKVVDQRVVAVYFNDDDRVEQIADYGIQDGKVFDFISRTTPTGGRDQSFVQQVLSGVIGVGPQSPF